MTRNKTLAFLAAAALVLCAFFFPGLAPEARAQTQAAPSPAPVSQKIVKRHYLVVHMFYQAIQVSSIDNPRDLRTFNYDAKIRDRMQQIFNAGGYQYGDKVSVWHRQGGDIALKIRGKPSKPK